MDWKKQKRKFLNRKKRKPETEIPIENRTTKPKDIITNLTQSNVMVLQNVSYLPDKSHNSRHFVNEDCYSLLLLSIDQETPGHRGFLNLLPFQPVGASARGPGGCLYRSQPVQGVMIEKHTHSLPLPLAVFPAHFSLRRPHKVNAWNSVAVMLFVLNISSKVWYNMLSQCIIFAQNQLVY